MSPEALPERFSEKDDCAICYERLVIPSTENEGPSYVIDDVQLLCQGRNQPGHHFHWSCLQEYDENGWDRRACPLCRGNPLNGQDQLIAIVRNEGGVSSGFDLGDAFDEEKADAAQPLSWKKERALLSALQFGELEEAERLLKDEGVSPNAFYEEGHMTALHMGAYNNDVEGAALLLRYGGNVSIKCESGETALDLAKQVDAKEFIKLLEEHGVEKP